MQIDPKIAFWFGVCVSIMLGIGTGTVQLTDMIPVEYIPQVKSWMSFGGFIGTTILTAAHGLSANKAGPLVPKDGG